MIAVTIISIIMLCLIICVMIGCYFFHRAIDAHSEKTFISIDSHKTLTDDDRWYLQNKYVKHVELETQDHIKLHASSIKQPSNNRWVIAVHGYMGRLEDMIPQAHQFYQLGYQILLPDLRGHGRSQGDVIGFGYLDHLDLLKWCQYLKEQGAEEIILYGVSMGASTVMMCADKKEYSIKAIIEDCGFSSLYDQLSYIVKKMVPKIPSNFLIFCLTLVMKWKSGYRISQADCLNSVSNAKVPMLFLHGERDTFIPISHMETLYDACPSFKQKAIIPGGRHANSVKIHPEEYWQHIHHFLEIIEKV